MAIRTSLRQRAGGPSRSDPFTDLLFNTLIGFVLLFFIAILFLNPEEEQAKVDLDAQYVITVTWPDNVPDDVDTWIEDPKGQVAWYRNRNAGLVHLDRDDRGMLNDTIMINGKRVANPLNQEVVAIRGIVPGEYTVNLHYYETETQSRWMCWYEWPVSIRSTRSYFTTRYPCPPKAQSEPRCGFRSPQAAR